MDFPFIEEVIVALVETTENWKADFSMPEKLDWNTSFFYTIFLLYIHKTTEIEYFISKTRVYRSYNDL